MPMNIRPLILCGGSGTRLWPLSRDTMPKQFIALNGERSLFQQTVLRVTEGTSYGRPVIVTAKAHRYEVERQLDAIAARVRPDRHRGPVWRRGMGSFAQRGVGCKRTVL